MTELFLQEISYSRQEKPVPTEHQSWMTTVAMAASATILLVIFGDTTWSMISTWRYSSYSHGFLVLPLSLYLIYTERKRVASIEVQPNPWALALMAGLGFAWFVGDLAAVQFVKQGALVGMLPGLVWLMLGTRTLRAILFPLLFLLFAVPVGEVLVPPLQDFTATFVVKGLDLVGIPALLERRLISVPSGVWEVAEACSGMRFLTASVIMGCFYAYVVYRTWARRVAFVVASVVVPILANGMRAFGTVVLGHFTNNRLAAGVDHLIYGWIFFSLVLFILFASGWPWREFHTDRSAGSQPTSPLPSTVSEVHALMRDRSSVWPGVFWAAAGIATVAVAPLSARVMDHGTTEAAIVVSAPSVLPPWKPSRSDIGRWKPRFIEVTDELKQTYTSDGRPVYLYLAYYGGGQGGKKLVSSINLIAESPGWIYAGERSRTATVDGQSISVHETALRSAEASLLVWNWYWVDGKFTDSPYRAKFLRAKVRLLGGPQASAFIAIGTDYASAGTEAAGALQDFLHHTSLREALDSVSK